MGVAVQGKDLCCDEIFYESQCLSRGCVVTVNNFLSAKRTEKSCVCANNILLDIFNYLICVSTCSGDLGLYICGNFIKNSVFGFFFLHLKSEIKVIAHRSCWVDSKRRPKSSASPSKFCNHIRALFASRDKKDVSR